LHKNVRTDLHEIFREVGNGPVNKMIRLNFGGDPDPYRDTGKTCLSVCPSVRLSQVDVLLKRLKVGSFKEATR